MTKYWVETVTVVEYTYVYEDPDYPGNADEAFISQETRVETNKTVKELSKEAYDLGKSEVLLIPNSHHINYD